jgi:hypothetical protein
MIPLKPVGSAGDQGHTHVAFRPIAAIPEQRCKWLGNAVSLGQIPASRFCLPGHATAAAFHQSRKNATTAASPLVRSKATEIVVVKHEVTPEMNPMLPVVQPSNADSVDVDTGTLELLS